MNDIMADSGCTASSPAHPARVALAHHWAVSMRGGEKVLEQLSKMFPAAPIHTLVHRPENLSPTLRSRRFHTSPADRWGWTRRAYKQLLMLHPRWIAAMSVDKQTDWLISSDSSMMKGIGRPEHTSHVCYCHSPPRYLWEMPRQYGGRLSPTFWGLKAASQRCRAFDAAAAAGVDHFIANSDFVRDRIARYYDRDSVVIHPPVDVSDFDPTRPRTDRLLVVSELTRYKRVDLAIEAANRLGRRLTVIGDGPQRKRLRRLAGPTVQMLGRAEWSVVKHHFETSAALLFPGIEDFGMTPVEAHAAGCPVIAYAAGGALETVTDGRTGMLFAEQTAGSLIDAIGRLDNHSFDGLSLHRSAMRFDASHFRWRFTRYARSIGIAIPDDQQTSRPPLALPAAATPTMGWPATVECSPAAP